MTRVLSSQHRDITTGDITTGDITTGDITTGDITTGDITTGDITTGGTRAGGTRTGLRSGALALAAGALLFGGAVSAGAQPASVDFGGGCVLDPTDKVATLASLRTRCTPEQQAAIYSAADPGAAPSGYTRGRVIRPGYGSDLAPMVWTGKTFATGPDGGSLTNRLADGTDAWPAEIYRAPSIADGDPTWVLNYAPSPTPQVYDEIREVVPGVWLGYSWWREAGTDTLLLAFALAN